MSRTLGIWPMATLLAMAGLPVTTAAQIADSSPSGFNIERTLTLGAPPERVYEALVQPGSWWHPDHTWSGSSANMWLEAEAGGCFCEGLDDGGSVVHLQVVYAAPGRTLRLQGGLGPLQTLAVDGVMTWTLSADGEGTELAFTYRVSGRTEDRLDGWAEPVAGVLAQQIERLARFVETGSPEAS